MNRPNYQLHQGDALAFLRSLPDDSVDAIIADPPYSSGGTHMTARTQQTTRQKYVLNDHKARKDLGDFTGDNRDQRSWVLWSTLWLTEALRVAKSGAPVVLFTDWRQLPSTTDVLQAAGATWRGVFPWLKPGGALAARGDSATPRNTPCGEARARCRPAMTWAICPAITSNRYAGRTNTTLPASLLN